MVIYLSNEITRYRLPQVSTPLEKDDIANKEYVDTRISPIGVGWSEFVLPGIIINLNQSNFKTVATINVPDNVEKVFVAANLNHRSGTAIVNTLLDCQITLNDVIKVRILDFILNGNRLAASSISGIIETPTIPTGNIIKLIAKTNNNTAILDGDTNLAALQI